MLAETPQDIMEKCNGCSVPQYTAYPFKRGIRKWPLSKSLNDNTADYIYIQEYWFRSMDDEASSPDGTLISRLASHCYALVSPFLYPLVIGAVIIFILFKVFDIGSGSSFGAGELIGLMGGEA